MRLPFLIFRSGCDSGNACDCLELPQFAEWYEADCVGANANISSNYTSAASNDAPPLLQNVKPYSILVAIVTGMAMLALIALSVLYVRFTKRNKIVVALEVSVEAAQQKIQEAEAFNRALKLSLELAQKEVDKAVGDQEDFLKQYKIKHAELVFENEIGHGQV